MHIGRHTYPTLSGQWRAHTALVWVACTTIRATTWRHKGSGGQVEYVKAGEENCIMK